MIRTTCYCLIVASLAGTAGAADLIIRERVAPSGPVVRLGDIAAVQRATPEETSRLLTLPLMPAPAPGTQQLFRTQELRNLLVAHGLDLNELRFTGAKQVTIGEVFAKPVYEPIPQPVATRTPVPAPATRKPQQQSGFRRVVDAPARYKRRPRVVSPSKIGALQQGILDQLTEVVQQQTGDVMLLVSQLELAQRNATTLADATDEPQVATTEPIAIGRQRFLISFNTAEGPVRFPVFALVHSATPMVVAAGPIARGEVLTVANTKVVPNDGQTRLAAGQSLFSSVESILGREAARTLREGQPLTDANCLPPTMVRRGELVEVVAGGDALRVTMRCKTRRDGRLGEMVEVETLDPKSKRKLMARVIGPGKLSVFSTPGATETNYLANQASSRRVR